MADYSWIGPLVQMGAGMLGGGKADSLDAQQSELLKSIYDELRNIPLPELERIVAEQLGPTAMEGVESDPEQRAQQMEVMNELRDIFESGGFDIQDRAALNELLNRTNVSAGAARRGLESDFAQRGQLGAGARLALGNMNAQCAANRANTTAVNIGAEGAKRKERALSTYADLAGDIRKGDFGEAATRAGAKDDAARWSASARERAGMRNAGLAQQQFGNRVTKATGARGAGGDLADLYGQRATGERNRNAAYAEAAGRGAQGLANDLDDEDEDETDAPHSGSHY